MELSILLFREGGFWVAQCLEFDIAAQGKKIEDAMYEFKRSFLGHVAIRQELKLPPLTEGLPPAPKIYWQRYEQAARLEKKPPRLQISPHILVDIDRAEYRVAA